MRHLCVLQAQVDGDAVRLAAQAPFLSGHDLTDEGIGIAVAIGELTHADAHGGQLTPRGDDAIRIETDNDILVSARRFRCDRIGLHVSLPTIGDIRAQNARESMQSQGVCAQMSEIGIRLREIRRERGLDQGAFGALGGVNRNTQSKYESGERSPDTDYLLRLKAVGIDIAYLVTGAVAEIEPEENDILRMSRQLCDEDRHLIIALMKSLLRKGESA